MWVDRRVAIRVASWFGTIAALLSSSTFFGCSNDGSSPSVAGQDGAVPPGAGGAMSSSGGGSPGGATSSGGASGSSGASSNGGSTTTSASMTGACIAYVEAVCNRRVECGADSDSVTCLTATFQCPDLLFSPGSTRTIASASACAEVWKTFSCDEMALGKVPSCTTPGTRQSGEKCMYGQQCASATCSTVYSCGVCEGLAQPGGACAEGSIVCPDGQTCQNGVCYDQSPTPLVPRSPAGAGEACYSFSICPPGFACTRATVSDASGVCAAPPPAGAPCALGLAGSSPVCGDDYRCGVNNTCVPLPGPGDACLPVGPVLCRKDSYCGPNLTCALRTDVGSSCQGQVDRFIQSSCKDGLWCFCSDTQCTSGACYERRAEGAACGDARGHCDPGMECNNGRCTAIDAVTRFATCGP